VEGCGGGFGFCGVFLSYNFWGEVRFVVVDFDELIFLFSLEEAGRCEEALFCYDRLLGVDPGNVMGFYYGGMAFSELGCCREAEKWLRRFLLRGSEEECILFVEAADCELGRIRSILSGKGGEVV